MAFLGVRDGLGGIGSGGIFVDSFPMPARHDQKDLLGMTGKRWEELTSRDAEFITGARFGPGRDLIVGMKTT